MTSASFAAFILLPVIIDVHGLYTTRSGETVTVTSASSRHDFGCRGIYGNAVREGWHRSGRLLFGNLTDNDIVGAACGNGLGVRRKKAMRRATKAASKVATRLPAERPTAPLTELPVGEQVLALAMAHALAAILESRWYLTAPAQYKLRDLPVPLSGVEFHPV